MDRAVFKFYCCQCRQKLAADAQDAGQTIQCPVCQTFLRVPSAAPVLAPASPAAVRTPPPLVASSGVGECPTRVQRAVAPPARPRRFPARVWFGVGVGVLAVVALGGVLVRFVLRPAPPPAPVASPDAWQPLALPPELLVPPADKLTGNNDEGERALRPAAGAAVVLAVRTNRPGAEPCAATAALVSAAMAPSNPAPTTAGVPSRPEDPDLDTGKTTVVVTASLRRKVFAELMAADAEATKAAAARFPVVLSGADAQAGQRRDLQEKQLQALRRVIREKHELTREQIAAIFADGIEDLQSGTTSAVGSY